MGGSQSSPASSAQRLCYCGKPPVDVDGKYCLDHSCANAGCKNPSANKASTSSACYTCIQQANEARVPLTFNNALNDRFEVDDPAAWLHLEERGYVVIANVLQCEQSASPSPSPSPPSSSLSDQVAETKMLFWDFLEDAANNVDEATAKKTWFQTTPELKRGDVNTWGSRRWPADSRTGLINTGAVGQSKFSWKLRGLPKVQEAFRRCWSQKCPTANDQNSGGGGGGGSGGSGGRTSSEQHAVTSLVTSFDGGNAFRPYGLQAQHDSTRVNDGWKTSGGWYHVDQGPLHRGKTCVQGLVTLTDANQHTGGLTVIPGSHHKHDLLFDNASKRHGQGDFVRVDRFDPRLDLEAPILVAAQAGDLLLWDSRTVHCNTPAMFDGHPVQSKPELLRVVAYICMMPALNPKGNLLKPEMDDVAGAVDGGDGGDGGGDGGDGSGNLDHDNGSDVEGVDSFALKRHNAVDVGATTTHWPYAHRVTSTLPAATYAKFDSCVGSVAKLTMQQRLVL